MDTTKTKKISFDKNNSLALKGIAIIMMVIHHCFLKKKEYRQFSISFVPFDDLQINEFSVFMKICVPIFAFISGYGLYLSYKSKKTSSGCWTLSRAIKTMQGFWFVWVVMAVWSQMGYGSVSEKFFKGKDIYISITNMIIDFLGLAKMLGTTTLDNTWWYMSAALVFIVLVPIAMKMEDNLPVIFVSVCVVPKLFLVTYTRTTDIMQFMPAFVLGMCVAKYDILNKWFVFWNTGIKHIIKFVVELFLVVWMYNIYINLPQKKYAELCWVIIPFVVIAFCCEFVNNIPIIRQVLVFLGTHSMNIFMTHTFIRWMFYKDFIYGFRHFAVIIFVLLITSLCLSIVLEFIKKRIHYDEFFAKICKRIEAYGQQ